jgi:hypothetical protein
MSCEITRGFGKGCNDSIGGVKEIYFGNWSTITTAGITYDAGGSVDALPTATIFKYVPHQNTANWVEETTASIETGSVFFTSTISLSLKGLSQVKQKELQSLAFGRWVIFVRDSNDNIWMIGTYEGCLMNGGNGSTGAAKGDLNGYTLTLVSEDKYRAPRLQDYDEVPFDNFAGITVEDN